jgi:acyl-CoA dehydrogenase
VSIALSEETSGIDALSIETTAVGSSDHFVVNGSKMFVTNADSADFILLFARTKPVKKDGRKAYGISMFLVDARNAAIRRAKLEKLGMDFNTLYSLKIKDLRVDAECLIGGLNDAWHSIKEIFLMDRILTSVSLAGTGRLALNLAAEHAKNRRVFGKPVGSNQGIQFPLADAIAQLLAAEAIALKAASQADAKRRFADDSNMALLESITAASSATDRAMQAFGGHGYLKNYDVERHWRDVRAFRSHPISEELLLASIAERSLGLPKSF